MNWFLECFRKYGDFTGRASRPEYWWFLVVHLSLSVVLLAADLLFGTLTAMGFGVLSGIFILVTIIPAWAVSVRRLHDTGRTGWWVLLGIVPYIGGLILLILQAQRGQAEKNAYGEPPAAAIDANGAAGTAI